MQLILHTVDDIMLTVNIVDGILLMTYGLVRASAGVASCTADERERVAVETVRRRAGHDHHHHPSAHTRAHHIQRRPHL